MNAIRLTYDGKSYELCFTRESVKEIETSGFNIQALVDGSTPVTSREQLFYGAFRARHKGIKRRLVDEIYAHVTDKNGLLSALVEMYGDTLTTLMDEPEDDGKNASWEMA